MACVKINSVIDIDEADVPQWKKKLMDDRKTYARTITSASGSIKFTVTCPTALRPKVKKQISLSKETLKANRNDNIFFEEKQIIIVDKFKGSVTLVEDCRNQNNTNSIFSVDELDRITTIAEDFPKPGLVQNLKSKYLSMMKTRKTGIEKRSSSFECMLENNNPFLEAVRRKSLSFSKNDNFIVSNNIDDDEHPRPSTVSTTKKIFEKPIEQNNIFNNTNPFIKPALKPKPLIKPRRNKPAISLNKPILSSECMYNKPSNVNNPFYNGVNSPTSPVKSGRNLY